MNRFFDSYNARFVDPHVVGQTFIQRNLIFKKLLKPENSLVVGPRGSGKTTLLKMLSSSAQGAWFRVSGNKTGRKIKFNSIYLGAERHLEIFSDAIPQDPESQNLFEAVWGFIFTGQLRYAIIDTLLEISREEINNNEAVSHLYLSISKEQQQELSKALSIAWTLPEIAYSFLEISAQLGALISKANIVIDSIKNQDGEEKDLCKSLGIQLRCDPVQSAVVFAQLANQLFDCPERKWCLCIDEVEVLPEFMQKLLHSSLRSTSQKLYLKLAVSPSAEAASIYQSTKRPMKGHDFTRVNLSFNNQQRANKFTRQLFASMCKSYELQTTSPEEILGISPMKSSENVEEKDLGARYNKPDGFHYKNFSNLYKVDSSFENYINQRGFDIEKLELLPDNEKAQIRKIIWIVALRLEMGSFQEYRSSRKVLKLRKSSSKQLSKYFSGADSVITICEGNPRIAIGILKPLIEYYSGTGVIVPSSKQLDAIQTAMAKFLSLISTISIKSSVSNVNISSAVQFVDDVGKHFSNGICGEHFKPEPSRSFVIGENINQSLLSIIKDGLDQGAFIIIPNKNSDDTDISLKDARLRLSYLLHPRYRLPLIKGSPIQLTNLLKEVNSRVRNTTIGMEDLFAKLS